MRAAASLLLGLVTWAAPLTPQTPTELGARFEREGRTADAARSYREALGDTPADVTALLGLERVSRELGELDGLRPYVVRALQALPRNELVREVEFRLAAALWGADSVAGVAARWMAVAPDSPNPYRQWASWLAERGDITAAHGVLTMGNARLGGTALSQYAAHLLVIAGLWVEAAQEWSAAVTTSEELATAAGAGLAQTPPAVRPAVLDVVLDPPGPPALRWLAADLLVRWDRAEEGWTLLDDALPEDQPVAALLLRRFADRARRVPPPEGARARGFALERLAEITTGQDAQRARLEAAQAFAAAGELASAERVLDRFRASRGEQPKQAAAAAATFIGVLADGGQLDEAETQYRAWETRLSLVDRASLRERLAGAWVERGDLDRAEDLLGADSTVGALAVRGWVALARGDLAGAKRMLRAAGPYAQGRAEVTRRAATLVLLERVSAQQSESLGRGLAALAHGDTTTAVRLLRDAGERLPPEGGRGDVLALAGEVAVDMGDYLGAERLLLTALAADSTGPAAPPATLALARAHLAMGRAGAAVERLEHLILTFPESAVVPQARRLLDRARGMVPRS